MIALGNILVGIGQVLGMLLQMMVLLVIARAVISWVNPDPFNPIVRFLIASTDPLVRPLRRYIPQFGGLDFTPVILIFILYFLKMALAQTLVDYGERMKSSYPDLRPSVFKEERHEITPVGARPTALPFC